MTPEFFERFFSVLALDALLGALALSIAWPLARTRPAAGELRASFAGPALWLAGLVAAVATSGSLYFSQVAHFVPCHLCWAQRACMYPLSLLLVAAWRGFRRARLVAIPLAAVGAGIATYHYALEWHPSLSVGVCDLQTPCDQIWFPRVFGFVSLPFMALCGFLAIISLLLLPNPTEIR